MLNVIANKNFLRSWTCLSLASQQQYTVCVIFTLMYSTAGLLPYRSCTWHSAAIYGLLVAKRRCRPNEHALSHSVDLHVAVVTTASFRTPLYLWLLLLRLRVSVIRRCALWKWRQTRCGSCAKYFHNETQQQTCFRLLIAHFPQSNTKTP